MKCAVASVAVPCPVFTRSAVSDHIQLVRLVLCLFTAWPSTP